MNKSKRILGRSSGNTQAEIMFIGEAPGRLGADGSGIPFHGDKSGHNFEDLLSFAGINRSDIFVTNAVLCNPRDADGNNSTPNSDEVRNCSHFLQKQIELINPKIIVTLGASALSALRTIKEHNFLLKDHVRTSNKWNERILIPLYHPGQRAMMSRSFANQRSDYQFVADQLRKSGKSTQAQNFSRTHLSTALIIDYIFHIKSTMTYFALHKLFYLIEYRSMQSMGQRLTNSYIIRQKDGPYCTDLHLFKIQKALPYIKSKSLSKNNILLFKKPETLFDERLIDQYEIEDSAKRLIEEIISEHGSKSNAALKRTVYFTRPMRNLLLKEMETKLNLYNSPIDFG